MERLDKSKNSSKKLENQNLLTSEVAKLRHLWRGKHQGDCFDKFCESVWCGNHITATNPQDLPPAFCNWAVTFFNSVNPLWDLWEQMCTWQKALRVITNYDINSEEEYNFT